eukprot:SAG31_NODE_2719_length_5189_cov_4.394029_6_plen_88_part_00
MASVPHSTVRFLVHLRAMPPHVMAEVMAIVVVASAPAMCSCARPRGLANASGDHAWRGSKVLKVLYWFSAISAHTVRVLELCTRCVP